jgi:hypothetical protein
LIIRRNSRSSKIPVTILWRPRWQTRYVFCLSSYAEVSEHV